MTSFPTCCSRLDLGFPLGCFPISFMLKTSFDVLSLVILKTCSYYSSKSVGNLTEGKFQVRSKVSQCGAPGHHYLLVVQFTTDLHNIHNIFESVNSVVIHCLTRKKLP
jgi:hypothetical protein